MDGFELDGVANVRDIGGPVLADGRRVVRGRIFRSASLHGLTPQGRQQFDAASIRHVIDLRTTEERAEHGYQLDHVTILSCPLAEDGTVREIIDGFRSGTITSAALEDWWTLTGVATAAERHVDSIRRSFDALLCLPSDEALLFHCRGGKDRTGLLSGLILETLGVSRSDVVADFLLSRQAPHHMRPAESADVDRAIERLGLTRAAIRSLSGVRAEWLIAVLEDLDERYGSVAGYVADRVGLDTGEVERFQERFLEPSPTGQGQSH